jgi:hypothetical protein
MNITKYRKLYLQENWAENKFMPLTRSRTSYLGRATILNDREFWSNPDKICVGFVMRSNIDIYRPLFSHSRQDILNGVHTDITRVPSKFWNRINTKYFRGICKLNLPLDTINYIISFVNLKNPIFPPNTSPISSGKKMVC